MNIVNKYYFKSEDYFQCDITPKRVVKYYELELYDFGTGYASINNNMYSHCRNMVVFSKPSQKRFSIGNFHCHALHFECNIGEICDMINLVPDCVVVNEDISNSIIRLLNNIPASDDLCTFANILNILCYVNNSYYTTISTNSVLRYCDVEKAKDYIDKNFINPISLLDIAAVTHLSPNYIRTKFLNAYGVSPHQYITDMRLSYVKKLLISTDKALSDIAYESGFQSQSHMNYAFKKRFGISPLNYKKSMG